MNNIRKLIFSDLPETPLGHNVLAHQWSNVINVWDNKVKHSNAIGIERFLKLVLIFSQFFFLGIYIRNLFGKYGKLHKHVGVELHVIIKLIVSIALLYCQPYNNYVVFDILRYFWFYWMILETLFYTGNLVFSEDVFAKPHSHKRNLILIIIDYITLNIDFANLYLITKSIKHSGGRIISDSIDALYFSSITSLTIGYGDIIPTVEGRTFVLFQSFVMLLFGILFLNFYISRVNNKN